MNVDPTALAYGFVGLAVGAGVHFWRAKTALEERCDFMNDMGEDLSSAFESAGIVLSDKNTPKPIRRAVLFLLSAYTDKARGRDFAKAFMGTLRKEHTPADGSDPISESMSTLARYSPPLAKQTHHVLASLSFGLMFIHLADDIRVERVRDEAAKDPESIWARIGRLFKSNGDRDHPAGGNLLPA